MMLGRTAEPPETDLRRPHLPCVLPLPLSTPPGEATREHQIPTHRKNPLPGARKPDQVRKAHNINRVPGPQNAKKTPTRLSPNKTSPPLIPNETIHPVPVTSPTSPQKRNLNDWRKSISITMRRRLPTTC